MPKIKFTAVMENEIIEGEYDGLCVIGIKKTPPTGPDDDPDVEAEIFNNFSIQAAINILLEQLKNPGNSNINQ